MGAWGTGPFQNDDALDWAAELEDAEDLSAIEAALAAVESLKEHVEAPAASRAIAACDVLARLAAPGGTGDAGAEGVDDWVAARARRGPPPATLVRRALGVLARVRGADSELADLWRDAQDDAPAWEASLDAIAERLRGGR